MRKAYYTRNRIPDPDGVIDAVRGMLPRDISVAVVGGGIGGGVDETFVWAVLDREPLTRWSFGRVTMLGDACHPMLPFMGQGGAQAIEDAAALTACLLRCSDEIKALKLYEAVRLPRASQIQMMSWENKSRFHMPDGPRQVERDAAEGMTDWSYRAIAWLYGHDADILPVAAPNAH